MPPATLPPELLPAALEALRRSGYPLSVSGLRVALSGTCLLPESAKAAVENLLRGEAAKGVLFEWPRFSRSARFWTRNPAEVARQVILAAASSKPLSQSALLTMAKKQAWGYPESETRKLVAELKREGLLHLDPPWGGPRARWTTTAPDIQRYLEPLKEEFEKLLGKLAALGVSPDSLLEGLPAPPAVPPKPVADTEETILRTLAELEPRLGLVIPVRKLREAPVLGHLDKVAFDRAVLNLLMAERIFLHDHSAPYTLPEAERDLLVTDGRGTFYVGIAWRVAE